MKYKDYYKSLNIERSAAQNDIKRAYRKLARKYHPDVSDASNAEDRFKEIGEAYEVLKDPEKRKAYDQLGENWQAGQSDFQPPPDWQDHFNFNRGQSSQNSNHDFSNFFEDLFGGTHTQTHGFNSKGDNVRAKIMIGVDDSINGTTKSITLNHRTLKVKIPKGIKEGQSIRLNQQGNPGTGRGPAGDLLLEVSFNPHQLYSIEGKNITLNLPVTPWELALGAKIEVPTPTGKVDIKIPPNSQSNKKLRLKGRGLPGKNAGDFFIVLQASIPPSTDPVAKSLHEQMKKEVNYNPRSHLL